MSFSETPTVPRIKALALLPCFLLIGACSDKMTPDQDQCIAEALLAVNECRKTVCTKPFWDNLACVEAYAAWNDTPVSLFESEDGQFAKLHSHLKDQWQKAYVASLEREVGHTIGLGGSTCGTRTPHRFDALKSERMKRSVAE